jgi:hypothetical protein
METCKVHVNDMNIETKLFVVDGEYRVRVRDLDADENISLVKCVNRKQAEEKFSSAVR